jgi:hypothetical protein
MGDRAKVELVLDCAEPKRLATFWREALHYRDYYADAALAVLVPKQGIGSPLLLQGVPEPKAGKNRMHLDIVADDIEAEVNRRDPLGQDVGPRAKRVLRLDRRRMVEGGCREQLSDSTHQFALASTPPALTRTSSGLLPSEFVSLRRISWSTSPLADLSRSSEKRVPRALLGATVRRHDHPCSTRRYGHARWTHESRLPQL